MCDIVTCTLSFLFYSFYVTVGRNLHMIDIRCRVHFLFNSTKQKSKNSSVSQLYYLEIIESNIGVVDVEFDEKKINLIMSSQGRCQEIGQCQTFAAGACF